jgi:micrococcal nuclease
MPFDYHVLSIDRIVDGDTVDLTLDLGFSISIRQRVRLLGVNTPEIASRDPAEKIRAKSAREFTGSWLGRQSKLVAHTTKDDKYGRILARIVGDDGVTVNDALLEAKLAVPYMV